MRTTTFRRKMEERGSPLFQGGATHFPKGLHKVRIDTVRQRGAPDFFFRTREGSEPRCVGPEATIVTVQVSQVEPIEGENAGNLKHFIDFVVEDGDKTIYEVDPSNPNGEGWLIRRDVDRLWQMAGALGQLVEVDGYGEINPDLLDLLVDGDLDGAEFGVEIVYGKPYKKADGTTDFNVMEKSFFSV